MADIRCPNCGKENPDFLDLCQFCQTPLKDKAKVQIGDKPTKRDTGELEPALPEWLKDVRRQAQEAADEDAAQAASMPKIQKDEPPDLLAGLAFQSADTDEENVPDWLTGLTSPSKPEQKPVLPFAPASPGTTVPAEPEKSGPEPEDEPEPEEPGSGRDELSEWFAQTAEQPAEPFTLEPGEQTDTGWGPGRSPTPASETQKPREEEDLSWLRNLEDEARKTGELKAPKQGDDWSFDPGPETPGAPGPEDLSWLNNLGALPTSDEPVQPPSEPEEDLSWLNTLGGASETSQPESKPPASGDDLGWLNELGTYQSAEEPAEEKSQPKEDLSWLNAYQETAEHSETEAAPSARAEDLSWLKDLGEPEHPQATGPDDSAQDDLGWLNSLQSSDTTPAADAPIEQDQKQDADEPTDNLPHVSPFTPRRTSPLSEEDEQPIPDWLKSATEKPSMPLGPQDLDEFREDYHIPTAPEEPFSWKKFVQGFDPSEEEAGTAGQQPPITDQEPSAIPADSPALSDQDVDSLFSVDMPDWLSRSEPETSEPEEDIGIHAEGGETLSPADLPSWVQAMRPVEAVISEEGRRVDDQPAEHEGPLAGFRGVIPAASIGSSRRPQPIPLKLQATEEQQASAALLEQFLLGETTARPLVSTPVVVSQRILRWVIAGLVLIVLGAVVILRTQIMPVPAPLPADADLTNVLMSISEDAPVLVILDYEPALAGEMEAVSGPLLNQLVMLRHPHLSFIATSPNGPALVERLLANTGINQPDGDGYIAGQNYINMGYLPGGESGVLAFIQSPQMAIPVSPVLGFSEYAAVILLTDHAGSARAWVEQLYSLEQSDPALSAQSLLAVSSAQAGPMLQPYESSRQINVLISGLTDAARIEAANTNRPGLARSYWDAFGFGIMLAVGLIVLGSLWSVFSGRQTRPAGAAEEQ